MNFVQKILFSILIKPSEISRIRLKAPIIGMMNYFNNQINWETFFLQAALDLEEKMKNLDPHSLNKSKLRIGLENNLLDWTQYEKWYCSQLGCSSLKMSAETELDNFIASAQLTRDTYSSENYWSEDLIPFFTWDQQLVVIGLQYNEKLVSIENHIFILAPPQMLSYIHLKSNLPIERTDVIDANRSTGQFKVIDLAELIKLVELEDFEDLDVKTEIIEQIVIDDLEAPENLVFEKTEVLTLDSEPKEPMSLFNESFVGQFDHSTAFKATGNNNKNPYGSENETKIWDFLEDRHGEFTFEIKKQFDAFVVLKISQNKTQVFKMDQELEKNGVNRMIFEYDLTIDGPLKAVHDSGKTQIFSLESLSMSLSKLNQVCITPLKRGELTLGFFMGFKKDALLPQDMNLLDELAHESAS